MNNLEHRVLRIEPISTAAVQRCARKSTEFASRKKIVGENRGEIMFLVTQDAAHKGFVLLNISFVHVLTLFLLINNFERRDLRIDRTTAVHSR